MGDKSRTGDVDTRIRGLEKADPELLPADVCVEDNRLCVDAVITGLVLPDGALSLEKEATPLAIGSAGGGLHISNFIIPATKTWRIVQFISGSEEESVGGNKCELWWEPDATPGNDVVITRHYISGGNNFQNDIFFTTGVGDGTAQVSIRRTRFGGGTNEVYAIFRGYEF